MSSYRAFISYSHTDARFAARLHRDLEAFRLPRDLVHRKGLPSNRIGPIFRDVADLGAASRLSTALTEALKKSEALIAICSPAATRSQWVDQEIREFRRLHGDASRVFAVITPDSGSGAPEDMFPAALSGIVPLAADARASADGRKPALLKVAAGLLDIGLDELVRRDARRRQSRLLAGTLASGVLAISMTILALLAVSAQRDARRRLTQSEDLIGFMLGDLRDQLVPLGQVRVLQSVGDKALEYFESLEDADLTSEAMLRKSRALYQIGDVFLELGQIQAAQQSFQLSLDQARRLASADPDNDERLFELAQAEYWVGFAALDAADLATAERQFLAYEKAAQTLRDRNPQNEIWAMEAFYASNNLGSLYTRRSQFQTAQRYFEDAIVRINELIEKEPTPDRLFERSTVFSWLGSTHAHQGNLADAKNSFLRAIDGLPDSANALYDEERAFQLGFLSDIELALGETEQARIHAEEAADIAAGLAESDRDSMDFLFARTAQELRVARIDHYSGHVVDISQLRSGAETLLAVDAPPSSWRLVALSVADLGIRSADASAVEWARGQLDAATSLEAQISGVSQEYIQLMTSLAQLDPNELPRLRAALPEAVEFFRDHGDFQLALPLLRAFKLLGDLSGYEEMRALLEEAGSKHPDLLSKG